MSPKGRVSKDGLRPFLEAVGEERGQGQSSTQLHGPETQQFLLRCFAPRGRKPRGRQLGILSALCSPAAAAGIDPHAIPRRAPPPPFSQREEKGAKGMWQLNQDKSSPGSWARGPLGLSWSWPSSAPCHSYREATFIRRASGLRVCRSKARSVLNFSPCKNSSVSYCCNKCVRHPPRFAPSRLWLPRAGTE